MRSAQSGFLFLDFRLHAIIGQKEKDSMKQLIKCRVSIFDITNQTLRNAEPKKYTIRTRA